MGGRCHKFCMGSCKFSSSVCGPRIICPSADAGDPEPTNPCTAPPPFSPQSPIPHLPIPHPPFSFSFLSLCICHRPLPPPSFLPPSLRLPLPLSSLTSPSPIPIHSFLSLPSCSPCPSLISLSLPIISPSPSTPPPTLSQLSRGRGHIPGGEIQMSGPHLPHKMPCRTPSKCAKLSHDDFSRTM